MKNVLKILAKKVRVSPLTVVLGLVAVLCCLLFAGVAGEYTLATFAPCLGSLAANIDKDCDNPRVTGYESIAIIINREDIDWASITTDSTNKRIIKTLSLVSGAGIKPYVIYNPRPNPSPFNGTQTEYSQDNNNYSKILQFYFEGIGAGASMDVVEPLKNGSYVAILQRKDHRGDGSFQILGYESGLVATAQVLNEETGYWLMTMGTNESSAEVSFFNTDYATTKAAFDALLAQA